jgi:hypothetical protein
LKNKLKISFSFFLLAGVMMSSILGIAQNESIRPADFKISSSNSSVPEKNAAIEAPAQKDFITKDFVFENEEEDNKEDLLEGATISLREFVAFRFDLSSRSRGEIIPNTVSLNILNCVFLI